MIDRNTLLDLIGFDYDLDREMDPFMDDEDMMGPEDDNRTKLTKEEWKGEVPRPSEFRFMKMDSSLGDEDELVTHRNLGGVNLGFYSLKDLRNTVKSVPGVKKKVNSKVETLKLYQTLVLRKKERKFREEIDKNVGTVKSRIQELVDFDEKRKKKGFQFKKDGKNRPMKRLLDHACDEDGLYVHFSLLTEVLEFLDLSTILNKIWLCCSMFSKIVKGNVNLSVKLNPGQLSRFPGILVSLHYVKLKELEFVDTRFSNDDYSYFPSFWERNPEELGMLKKFSSLFMRHSGSLTSISLQPGTLMKLFNYQPFGPYATTLKRFDSSLIGCRKLKVLKLFVIPLEIDRLVNLEHLEVDYFSCSRAKRVTTLQTYLENCSLKYLSLVNTSFNLISTTQAEVSKDAFLFDGFGHNYCKEYLSLFLTISEVSSIKGFRFSVIDCFSYDDACIRFLCTLKQIDIVQSSYFHSRFLNELTKELQRSPLVLEEFHVFLTPLDKKDYKILGASFARLFTFDNLILSVVSLVGRSLLPSCFPLNEGKVEIKLKELVFVCNHQKRGQVRGLDVHHLDFLLNKYVLASSIREVCFGVVNCDALQIVTKVVKVLADWKSVESLELQFSYLACSFIEIIKQVIILIDYNHKSLKKINFSNGTSRWWVRDRLLKNHEYLDCESFENFLNSVLKNDFLKSVDLCWGEFACHGKSCSQRNGRSSSKLIVVPNFGNLQPPIPTRKGWDCRQLNLQRYLDKFLWEKVVGKKKSSALHSVEPKLKKAKLCVQQ